MGNCGTTIELYIYINNYKVEIVQQTNVFLVHVLVAF